MDDELFPQNEIEWRKILPKKSPKRLMASVVLLTIKKMAAADSSLIKKIPIRYYHYNNIGKLHEEYYKYTSRVASEASHE